MSRAAQYDRNGGPEVLRLVDVADAQPAAGTVIIRVRAAGLNPFDAKVRTGFIASDAPFPRRVASDVAGTVIAVGDASIYWDGTAVQVGDEVFGSAAGSAAEHATAQAKNLVRRTHVLAPEIAGSLNVAGLTAVSVLATLPVGPDDTVLVGGASGAVGFVAAQLAIAAGATVIGTASERNHEMLRSAGVMPLTYGDGLAERMGAAGEITAVFDCHGREALDAGIRLGVPADRMVAIAAYDAIDELGVRNAEREARTPENLSMLAEEIVAGRLVFPVAQAFALDDIALAFAALETARAPGKIVITP